MSLHLLIPHCSPSYSPPLLTCLPANFLSRLVLFFSSYLTFEIQHHLKYFTQLLDNIPIVPSLKTFSLFYYHIYLLFLLHQYICLSQNWVLLAWSSRTQQQHCRHQPGTNSVLIPNIYKSPGFLFAFLPFRYFYNSINTGSSFICCIWNAKKILISNQSGSPILPYTLLKEYLRTSWNQYSEKQSDIECGVFCGAEINLFSM